MALCTAYDIAVLTTWNVLRDYNRNRAAFIAIGKASYWTLLRHGGPTVAVPSTLERPLQAALEAASLFKTICATKWHAAPNPTLPSNLHAAWSLALARYILDNEWARLIAP